MYDTSMMSEEAVIACMGRKRFERLLAGKWLSPCYRTKGRKGRPTYPKNYVQFRLAEDKRIHHETRPATVKKSQGRSRERVDFYITKGRIIDLRRDEQVSPEVWKRLLSLERRIKTVFAL